MSTSLVMHALAWFLTNFYSNEIGNFKAQKVIFYQN